MQANFNIIELLVHGLLSSSRSGSVRPSKCRAPEQANLIKKKLKVF
jgi:hypothetical protein